MTAFIAWYLASSLLGWLTFPITFRLFPALADRGYTLARTAGLLLWAWAFWILASLGILDNNVGGLLLALLILVIISLASLITNYQLPNTEHWSLNTAHLRAWLASHKSLVLTTEFLFLAAFAFLAFVRASNPDATGTEKPMELAFINGILRSPTFPPNDPWLSGWSISYYHFGYIMTAMLAKLIGTSGNVAFNLMSALVFALAAVGSYGVLYNLLVAYAGKQENEYTSTHVDTQLASPNSHPASQLPFTNYHLLALLAPLFLLLISNAEGLLEVIHGLGWFWPSSSDLQPATFNFWTWLNIKDLTDAPGGTAIPHRFWWWWRASRVVQDFDLAGAPLEVIDEFPFFSFLLGDLHPHVLALPFNMLALGTALNIYLGGWRGSINALGYRLRALPIDFFFAALVLGGLAFLNTWDILVSAALIVGAYLLVRIRDDGLTWPRLEDALVLGLPLAAASLLLYLPFYFGFSSQAGGILPNLVTPTRGAHLWVMWATLLIPILVWLLMRTPLNEPRPRYKTALIWTLSGLLFLWAFSWLLALVAQFVDPAFSAQYLASQNQPDVLSLFQAATLKRLTYLGGTLSIAFVFWLALSKLISSLQSPNSGLDTADDHRLLDHHQLPITNLSSAFILFIILLASLLVLTPDFVYLRDGFGYRINTVFKFYYQAWQLWAIAAAFASAILMQTLHGVRAVTWNVVFILVVGAGLVYPILSVLNKTNNFNPDFDYTLDSSAHLTRFAPEDAAVIHFLSTAPMGVVAESIGGSYSGYARIATYTGLPTVLGWDYQVGQQLGSRAGMQLAGRSADAMRIYATPDIEEAKTLLRKYQIHWIVVGAIERKTFMNRVPAADFEKFAQFCTVAERNAGAVLYRFDDAAAAAKP